MEMAAYTLDIPHLPCRSAVLNTPCGNFTLIHAVRVTVAGRARAAMQPQHWTAKLPESPCGDRFSRTNLGTQRPQSKSASSPPIKGNKILKRRKQSEPLAVALPTGTVSSG